MESYGDEDDPMQINNHDSRPKESGKLVVLMVDLACFQNCEAQVKSAPQAVA